MLGNLNLQINNLSHVQHQLSNQFQVVRYNYKVILYGLNLINSFLDFYYYIIMVLNNTILMLQLYVGMYNPLDLLCQSAYDLVHMIS